MPQANSTTSRPRATSPSASESTLPCSAVMIAASSCLRALSSSRKAKTTCVRRVRDAFRHSAAAAAALCTASSTTPADARSTRPDSRPVAGS